jgi:hypothetical protein
MIRLAGILLCIVGGLALWIYAREGNVMIGLLGGIDVSASLLILSASWPRRIEHRSAVEASHLFRK